MQGGNRQNDTGWTLCSNDDIIMLMTSLLLLYPAKIVDGLQATRPTRPLPPAFVRIGGHFQTSEEIVVEEGSSTPVGRIKFFSICSTPGVEYLALLQNSTRNGV